MGKGGRCARTIFKGLWSGKGGRDSAAVDGSDRKGQSKASLAANKFFKKQKVKRRTFGHQNWFPPFFVRAPSSRLKMIGLEAF